MTGTPQRRAAAVAGLDDHVLPDDLAGLVAGLTPGDVEEVRRFHGFLTDLGRDADPEHKRAIHRKYYPEDAEPAS